MLRRVMIAAESVYVLWTPGLLSAPLAIRLDWNSSVTDVAGYASQWSDSGPNGWHFSQGVVGRRPEILAAGINGKRALRFNESYLQCADARGIYRNTGAGWAFAVIRKRALDVSAENRYWWCTSGGQNNVRFGVRNGGGGSGDANRHIGGFRRIDTVSGQSLAGPVAADNEWEIVQVDMSWSSAAATIFVNDSQAAAGSILTAGVTSDTESNENSAPLIGASKFGTAAATDFTDSDIACVFAGRGSLLSVADRQRLAGWAAHECGLSGVLSADHPFRHVPPYANTAVLQPSFGVDPTVIGFVAATDGGDVGIADGPAVANEFGLLLNSQPVLSAGQGITVTSDGTTIAVRLDNLMPAVVPARAVVMDHRGSVLATVPLTDNSGHFDGAAPGELVDAGVYYVRIEAA